MTHLSQSRDFQSELAKALINRLPPEVLARPETADIQATAKIRSIEFVESDKDAVYMRITAALIYVRRTETDFSDYKPIEFHSRSVAKDLDVWLNTDDENFSAALTECIQIISEKMAEYILKGLSPASEGMQVGG